MVPCVCALQSVLRGLLFSEPEQSQLLQLLAAGLSINCFNFKKKGGNLTLRTRENSLMELVKKSFDGIFSFREYSSTEVETLLQTHANFRAGLEADMLKCPVLKFMGESALIFVMFEYFNFTWH